MVSTHLKNISQNGSLPQIGVKIKNHWNHHLGFFQLQEKLLNFSPHNWNGLHPHALLRFNTVCYAQVDGQLDPQVTGKVPTIYTPPRKLTAFCTQNDGLEKATAALNMAILWYVKFLGCGHSHSRLKVAWVDFRKEFPAPKSGNFQPLKKLLPIAVAGSEIR